MNTQTIDGFNSSASQKILKPRYIAYALITFVLVLTCVIRFHLRNIPLERDEGEYAYAGQLMLQGIPPYKLAYNMKLPGTYAAYALIMGVFGETIRGVHIGLILVNGIPPLPPSFLGRRLFGEFCGVVAAETSVLL